MLTIDLSRLAFYSRVPYLGNSMWLFGTLHGGREPIGNRTLKDDYIFWYSAERAVGSFICNDDARISFYFSPEGNVTLTGKSRSLVWVNAQFSNETQSVINFLEDPSHHLKFIKGQMLRFETQLNNFFNQDGEVRRSSYTTDISLSSAPSLEAKLSQL